VGSLHGAPVNDQLIVFEWVFDARGAGPPSFARGGGSEALHNPATRSVSRSVLGARGLRSEEIVMRTHRLIAMLGSFVLAVAAVGTASGESGDAKIGNTPKNVGAAVIAPPLDSKGLDNKRLDQIQRTGEAGHQLGAIRELGELQRAGELPDLGEMRGLEDRFGDAHIGRGDEIDADKMVREAFGLRELEHPAEEGPRIGQSGSGLSGDAHSGAGTAAGALGVPTSDGRAATGLDADGNPIIVVVSETSGTSDTEDAFWIRTQYSDGSKKNRVVTLQPDGIFNSLTRRESSDGSFVLTQESGEWWQAETGQIMFGEVEHSSRRWVNQKGHTTRYESNVDGPAGQGDPTDDAIDPDADPTNPATGLGGNKAWGDPMAIVKQPSHGDAETGTSGPSPTSRLGTAVVTNPGNHDGSSGRGGGGGGIGSNQPEGDPEPDIPGGSTTAAAVGMNAESLDLEMGALEAPPE